MKTSGQLGGAGTLTQTAPAQAGAKGQETRLYNANSPNKPSKQFLDFIKKSKSGRLLQVGRTGIMDTVDPTSEQVKELEQQFLGNTLKQAKIPQNIKSVKIAADSGSIPSLIANTSDMNVGLQDEVTQIAYT